MNHYEQDGTHHPTTEQLSPHYKRTCCACCRCYCVTALFAYCACCVLLAVCMRLLCAALAKVEQPVTLAPTFSIIRGTLALTFSKYRSSYAPTFSKYWNICTDMQHHARHMYYRRAIDKKLLEWKDAPRRRPLLIRGVRQVTIIPLCLEQSATLTASAIRPSRDNKSPPSLSAERGFAYVIALLWQVKPVEPARRHTPEGSCDWRANAHSPHGW